MRTNHVILVSAAILVAGGCASDRQGSVYNSKQTQQAYSVTWGTIQRLQTVEIAGEPGPVGTIGGGVVGGALGSTIGGGSGRVVAIAVGAVAGAVAGAFTEKAVTGGNAWEIELKTDDGRSLVIVQEKEDGEVFTIGQHVRLLSGPSGNSRVRP